MDLKDLINNFKIENSNCECKARLNRDNCLGWLKTIAGFANSEGGFLYLGVEDKTFKLIGFDSKEIDNEKNYFYNQIKEHFPYTPSINSKSIDYKINGKIRFILEISIDESQIKPLILKYDGMPLIYKRRDGYTNGATIEEIREMSLESPKLAFDKNVTDIDFDINNFKDFSELYSEKVGEELTIKKLASIPFFNENKKLYRGAALFLDDYRGDETKIVFTQYKAENRGDDLIFATRTFKGNLIINLLEITNLIDLKMNHGFLKKENGRINVDAYPKRSVFEAIINAIVHRDYFLDGTEINVDMFSNRLVITSPGSMLYNKNLERTTNLSSFASKRRNELISNIFIALNLMEAKGTGFEKIESDYKNCQDKHKPYIFAKNNQFSIVLPDLTNENGISVEEDNIKIIGDIYNHTRFDNKILSLVYYNKLSAPEIAIKLGISDSTFLRKNILLNMVKQDYLKTLKERNALYYLTNHDKVFIV